MESRPLIPVLIKSPSAILTTIGGVSLQHKRDFRHYCGRPLFGIRKAMARALQPGGLRFARCPAARPRGTKAPRSARTARRFTITGGLGDETNNNRSGQL